MMYEDLPTQSRSHCPGCRLENDGRYKVGEKVTWRVRFELLADLVLTYVSNTCRMTYCWSKVPVQTEAFLSSVESRARQRGTVAWKGKKKGIAPSLFCRIDFFLSQRRVESAISSKLSPPRTVRYCGQCGGGSYDESIMQCTDCGDPYPRSWRKEIV
jgi:hypothetical protein